MTFGVVEEPRDLTEDIVQEVPMLMIDNLVGVVEMVVAVVLTSEPSW